MSKKAGQNLAAELIDIVRDELNIKELEFIQDASSLIQYVVMPDNQILGPKYGADFPKAKEALASLDPNQVAALVNSGQEIPTDAGFVFQPDEILLSTDAAEGYATVDSNFLTVAIETEISPELRQEGLARELIRRIQDFRKQADFDISDRIHLVYQASPLLADAIQGHRDYIKEETLCLEMHEGEPEKGMYSGTSTFEGEEVTLGLKVIK